MDLSRLPTAPSPSTADAAPPASGSEPLRNAKYERFAFGRAAMLGLLEAARYAGYAEMTAGNAAKIDRKPMVRDRVRFLAGDSVQAVNFLRAKVMRKLNVIRDVSMHDFIRMERDPAAVAYLRETMKKRPAAEMDAAIERLPLLPYLDLSRIAALAPEEQREILSAVKSVAPGEHGPKLELHDPLAAMAQLRKLVGMDVPEEHRLKGDLTLETLVGASYARAKEPPQVEAPRQGDDE